MLTIFMTIKKIDPEVIIVEISQLKITISTKELKMQHSHF